MKTIEKKYIPDVIVSRSRYPQVWKQPNQINSGSHFLLWNKFIVVVGQFSFCNSNLIHVHSLYLTDSILLPNLFHFYSGEDESKIGGGGGFEMERSAQC